MKRTLLMLIAMVAMVVLPSFAQEVNMSRYITLTVKSGEEIKMDFKTDEEIPIRIVSGKNKQDLVIGSQWYYGDNESNFTVTSEGTTITIYGDITGFECNNNRELLTNVDISKNTMLKNFYCGNNAISSLNLKQNKNLEILGCYDNNLTSLDVSKNINLMQIACQNNNLTSLDVSKNTKLGSLFCFSNKISSLKLTNNLGLIRLDCSNNRLTSLNVSNNTNIKELICFNNKLTTLDISNNSLLYWLVCHNNPINTEALNRLYCSLPDRNGNDQISICFPINLAGDSNEETVLGSTTDIARKKNWEVMYYNNNTETEDFVPSKGNYQCK